MVTFVFPFRMSNTKNINTPMEMKKNLPQFEAFSDTIISRVSSSLGSLSAVIEILKLPDDLGEKSP